RTRQHHALALRFIRRQFSVNRIQPREAVRIRQRYPVVHLFFVGRRVELVGIQEYPTQARRQNLGDGAFSRTGYSHHHNNHRFPSHTAARRVCRNQGEEDQRRSSDEKEVLTSTSRASGSTRRPAAAPRRFRCAIQWARHERIFWRRDCRQRRRKSCPPALCPSRWQPPRRAPQIQPRNAFRRSFRSAALRQTRNPACLPTHIPPCCPVVAGTRQPCLAAKAPRSLAPCFPTPEKMPPCPRKACGCRASAGSNTENAWSRRSYDCVGSIVAPGQRA